MKKRAPIRTGRSSSTGKTAAPGVRPSSKRAKADAIGRDPSPVIVPEQQFDALLALLDDPPSVSDDLHRDVADRRWK
ncbi:hypothetical protein [uncultured Methylobacterium sp.]|uniref:hypothetical protein n=1 Tax=uncultured Methylobacterium sp. TaxID=157278 RepID=UPI0035CB9A43